MDTSTTEEPMMQTTTAQQTETGRHPTTAADHPPRRLFTLPKFAERNSGFITLAAVTNQVFKAKTRLSTKGEIPGNGMDEAGAIVRLNGRVLIDEDRYFAWVDSQQQAERA
jgi:hypothetical protein